MRAHLITLLLALGLPLELSAQASRFEKGLTAYQQNDFTEAHKHFTAVMETSPHAITPQFYLAETQRQLKHWFEAGRNYAEVIKQQPSHTQALLGLGVCQYQLKQYRDARTSLTNLITQTPNNASAHYYLGLSAQALEQHGLAIRHLDDAKRINPSYNDLALVAMGDSYRARGETDKARHAYQRASKGDSNAARAAKLSLTAVQPVTAQSNTAKPNTARPNTAQNSSTPEEPLSVELWAGFEYDDNVTVSETDRNSNEDDQALVLELDAEYRIGRYQNWNISTGYDLYQSLYSDLDQFNLRSHGLWGVAERTFSDWDLSGHYRFGYHSLDNDKLYNAHSLRPTAGYQWSTQWYTSAFIDWQRKNFDDSRRDGTQIQPGIDGIWFPGQADTYLALSFSLDNDDTDGREFRYTGIRLRGAWHFPFLLRGHGLKGVLSYRIDDRDYDHITPSIGKKRDEEKHTLKAAAEYRLNNEWRLKASYEYIRSDSNLPTSDYREHIVNISAGWTF